MFWKMVESMATWYMVNSAMREEKWKPYKNIDNSDVKDIKDIYSSYTMKHPNPDTPTVWEMQKWGWPQVIEWQVINDPIPWKEKPKPLSDISNMPILWKFMAKARDKIFGNLNIKPNKDVRN